MAYAVAEVGANVAVLDALDKPHDDFFELESRFGIKTKAYKCVQFASDFQRNVSFRLTANPTRTDVTDGEALSKVFDEVVADFGRIDSLITAAGIVVEKPFLEHNFDEVKKLQLVNTVGTFYSVQLAARQMEKQGDGGSILMIASITSHIAVTSQTIPAYAASKGAVLTLCKHLAVELGPKNIRINTISPGYISTDMTAKLAEIRPELLSVFTREPPLKRMGERTDLKGVTVYLLR